MKLKIYKRQLRFLLFVATLFLIACGKKGDPTLNTFEKPMPVKEIRVVHRENEIIISWSYPASEREKIKGFYIEKAEIKSQESGVKSPDFKNITFLKNDASQFVDKDFKVNQEYLYKIRVYSLRDVISDDSPVVGVNPQPLPPPPVNLSYRVLHDSIEIGWNEVTNNRQSTAGVRYNIYRSYEKGKYPVLPLNNIPLTEPFFKDRIETGRPVFYTIRSLLDTDIKDEGYLSEELEVNPESFVPSKPYNLKYVPSKMKVYLMWNENPETWVSGYRIYRKRESEAEFRFIGESILPAFTDNEPLSSKTIYYITAMGPKKESIPSETIEVYPLVER